MLNSEKKIRALHDKKNKYSNSRVNPPPPPAS